MSGFITIERKLWDHPLFKREPMSEREAWIWMIAQCAWSDTQHRVGNVMVDVPRGSFMATLREMQSAFMWGSDKRVRTFLKTLENGRMIGRTSVGSRNASKTHVTICNYDEYQSRGRTTDAPRTHGQTHHGRTTDAVKEQDNKITSKDTNVSLSDHPPAIDEVAQAIQHFNGKAVEVGWPTVQKPNPQRRNALKARMRDVGGLENWVEAINRASVAPHLIGQNDRGWTATFDWLCKPANFTKLMEGNYDPRSNQIRSNVGNGGGRGPHHDMVAAFAEVAAQRSGAA